MHNHMKTKTLKTLALVPVAILILTSCSSTPEGESAAIAVTERGVPGGIVVETYQVTATVTSVDPATRKVTLVTPAGKKTVFKAGPEVVNFPQIRVGDQVKATLTEELVVFMATDAPPQGQGAVGVVALAPVGSKPGALVAETVQVKARVTEIDHKKHKATLQFPDGSTKTVAVRKDVDLTKRSVGEEVVLRATETLAVTVEKP
jgi:hypothetical protein